MFPSEMCWSGTIKQQKTEVPLLLYYARVQLDYIYLVTFHRCIVVVHNSIKRLSLSLLSQCTC